MGGDLKASTHELVRTVDQEIDGIAEGDSDLCVSFHLGVPDSLPSWLHPATLCTSFRFSERLTLRLASENLGSRSLVLSRTLYTYFAVGDSHEIAVGDLRGACCIETLKN